MPRGIPASGERVNRADERRAMRPTTIDPNQFYSLKETAAARDQSVASLYKDIAAKRINVTRQDGRSRVLGAEIIRANRQQAGQAA